jgi:hypothetical protein
MSKQMSPASAVFLERFFGEHNELKLEEIESGSGVAGLLLPWVTRLKLVHPLPTIVARKFVDDEGLARYTWYGVAQTQRELRDLSEDLTAFVGPTWSTFRGDRATLNVTDPTDVAVQEFTNGLAFKFSGTNKKIWDSLELMRNLWERRKTLELEDLRPPGRVLRDFFMALQASNRESAESALRILRDNHGYDAINISFLKIQMLASLERWGELLDSPNFSDILQVRRPVAVTQALISAVYHSELMRFEEQQDPIAARDYFRGSVLPRYGSLFSVHAGMRTPEALKSFMLFAISAEPPIPGLRDEIMALPDLQSDEKSYLQDIANLLTASPPKYEDLLAQAKELLWSGEYDQAFQVAFDAPESTKRAQILLHCAYELQTLTSERAAIAAFKNLPAEDQQSLTTMRSTREFLERFSAVAPETDVPLNIKAIPDGWLAWLSQLYEDSTWTRAMEVARQGAEEWDINSLLDEPNGIGELAQRLGSYPSAAEATLHNSLPFFLEFFRRDAQYPRRECQSVYNVLLDLLTISTYGGDDDLNLFNELVLALLSLGLDSSKYSSVIENAEDLWGRYASPSKTDWILDLLDSLTIYPSPAEEKRSALLSFVANKITEFARRVEPAQWDFLALLASDLREGSLVALVNEYRKADEIQASVPAAADPYIRLAGKSIAIYTLTEAVAQRVKSIIQTRCGSAVVHLCHDKVGSERLRQLARSADILIMATASAKHAATGFIEAHRAGGEPLLRPSGKGSASMLKVLHSYIVAELTPA